jgi:hypothetical protein
MRSPTRLAAAFAVIAALVLPVPVFAAADALEALTPVTFDTPAPKPATARPTPKPTPKPTKKPRRTPPPAVSALPIAPARDALSVAYSGKGALPQAPLLAAELAGYFDAVGLDRVTISRSADVLADVLSGDADIGVVSKTDAATAIADDPTVRAIAGYRNYPGGVYGGDVLLAAPGLVADEPSTVIAFLSAYVGALQDLAETDGAIGVLGLIQDTDLRIYKQQARTWPQAVDVFAPYDGGFGSIDDGDGLGELSVYLTGDDGSAPDLDAFIAGHTLSIAQTWSGLETNPTSALAGPPGIVDLTVGMASPEAGISPITVARDAGYFEDAGFGSVTVLDVEQPLLGVLQGELDLSVLDVADAADGSAQGLPLAALAGHRNYGDDGSYGGDVLVASTDVLSEEGSTASAFLIAYVRALQDLTEEDVLRPHDGGFGDRTKSGGLGDLEAYLVAAGTGEPDFGNLTRTAPLEFAQAWWGLPANPTVSEEVE